MSNLQSTPIGATSDPKPTTAAQKKAWKASQDFEAILLRQIFQSMRKSTSILAGTDGQEEPDGQMVDMAWDGLANQVSKSGGFGLAKFLYPQMLGQQGANIPSDLQSPPIPSSSTASLAYRASQADSKAASGKGSMDLAIHKAAADSGLDPALIRAVIQTESGGNASARSPKGAVGPMQLMPKTASDLGVDPHDPVQNILGGSRYLASLKKQFGNDDLALAAYNAGPGAVTQHGGIPPYPETQAYVRKVLQARDTLKRSSP